MTGIHHRPRILIVEDEPSIADNILYSLESEGFALVILDVGLPDTTGFEVFCHKHHRVPLLPISIIVRL